MTDVQSHTGVVGLLGLDTLKVFKRLGGIAHKLVAGGKTTHSPQAVGIQQLGLLVIFQSLGRIL